MPLNLTQANVVTPSTTAKMIERISKNRFGVEIPIDNLGAPQIGQGGYQGFKPRTEVLEKGWKSTATSKALSCDIKIEHDHAFEVRDGATLYGDVYRPNTDDKVPAIICYGPFGKKFTGQMSLGLMTAWNLGVPDEALSGLETFEGIDPADWVPRGYAVINVDSRGSHDSEGTMVIIGSQEGEDGHDVIEAIARLPWCNGSIGMAGNSHLAITQWHIAAQKPPSLKAIAPWEGCGDLYREQFVRGGIYGGDLFDGLIQKYMLKGRGGVESFKQMFAKYPQIHPWWADKRADMTKIEIPTYITGTWSNTMHGMGAMRGWKEVRGEKWLRFHGTQEWFDIWGNEQGKQELMSFFDRYLKNVQNDWESTPRVRVAALRFGETEPISNIVVPDLPVPNTRYEKLYLSTDSELSPVTPPQEQQTSYSSETVGSVVKFGHKFEKRTILLGVSKATLFMSCPSHDDMDVYVILRKLSASGKVLKCLNVPWKGVPVKSIDEIDPKLGTEVILYSGPTGVLRASRRETDASRALHNNQWPYHKHERDLKIPAGEIVQLEIGIWATGIEFEAGESVSFEISGSYPSIANFGANNTLNKGQHVVHFGGQHDSHVTLPFVDSI